MEKKKKNGRARSWAEIRIRVNADPVSLSLPLSLGRRKSKDRGLYRRKISNDRGKKAEDEDIGVFALVFPGYTFDVPSLFAIHGKFGIRLAFEEAESFESAGSAHETSRGESVPGRFGPSRVRVYVLMVNLELTIYIPMAAPFARVRCIAGKDFRTARAHGHNRSRSISYCTSPFRESRSRFYLVSRRDDICNTTGAPI